MSTDSKRRLRFGVFEVDTLERRLFASGRPVHLQDQPFRILELLISRPGEIVTREELRRSIWDDDIHVEFDSSLNTAVARLREALQDSPTRPEYIETVPRRGYRFIAQLGTTAPPAPRPAQRTNLGRWLALSALLAVAIIALLGFSLRRTDRSSPASPSPVRLTFFEGIEDEADFSPDGSHVVFTWNGERQDNFDIYVMSLAGAAPYRLTDDPGRDFSPAWSPDGKWIAFLRDAGDGGAVLLRVPPTGGREDRIGAVAISPSRATVASIRNRYLTWSRDSRTLIVADRRDENGSSLHVFELASEARRRLTSPPPGSSDLNPAVSPDGKTLLFTRLRGGVSTMLSQSLGDRLEPIGDPMLMSPADAVVRGLAWGLGGRVAIVSAAFSAAPHLGRLARISLRSSGQAEELEFAGWRNYLPAYSQRARRLVYSKAVFDQNIWRLNLDQGRAAGAPVKLIASSGFNANMQYSHDGKRIAFQSDRSGDSGVWICDSEGRRQWRMGNLSGGTPRFAPDGDKVVFDAPSEGGHHHIWMIGSDGGPPEQLTNGPADDRSPNWSRDGQWVYFGSDRGDGYQIWKINPKTLEAKPVTRKGGFHAIESPHDKTLYYTKGLGDYRVWTVPIDGGEETQVLDAVTSWTNFDVTPQGLYYTPSRSADGTSAIMFHDFTSQTETEVFRPQKPISAGFAVSPDGKHVIFAQIDEEGSDLMLVEDFE